ncbi:MAG: CRISP-associated protein Cas1 [Clostridiales bacterium]|jgi:CRISPR-associated protein Cas1|nr:CRISP-associated protein Cas1 [Clostridiales bacterium]
MKRDYYIFAGQRLSRKNNTLRIHYEDGTFKEIPVEKVNTLNIFNEVDFNTSAINFLNRHEITCHFFNYYGYYTGSFYPKECNLSGELLVRQVLAAKELDKALLIAKAFINGAAYNIQRNLRYYQLRGKAVATDEIEKILAKIESADTIEALMGFEGNLRRHYYAQWGVILNDAFDFDKRTIRPPENELNALLSFLNSLFYTVCVSEIYKTHLNPTVSFLHTSGRRRFSLSLDVSEVFKPLIVDRLIFRLINKRMIDTDDFERASNGIFLKESARKKVVKAFEETLNQTIIHKKLGKSVRYRSLVRLELLKLEKYLVTGELYEPFTLDW